MKGIILAEGSGSQLYPLTMGTSKLVEAGFTPLPAWQDTLRDVTKLILNEKGQNWPGMQGE